LCLRIRAVRYQHHGERESGDRTHAPLPYPGCYRICIHSHPLRIVVLILKSPGLHPAVNAAAPPSQQTPAHFNRSKINMKNLPFPQLRIIV
jgi:hypothetical protein